MESLLTDLRFAIRWLARSPLIMAIAVATLAVGVASTTVMFSIVNAAMLQPLQYGNPDRLVLVWMARRHKAGYGNPPAPVYLAWRERAKSFEPLSALADTSFDLRGNPPVRVQAAEATADFFPAVEVQPALGRVFTEEEARNGERVVVLGHALWKNHFGSDPNIAGKTVVLSGVPWTVIGVMPASFSFIRHHDLWVPMDLAADRQKVHNALMPVAKLRRGVSTAQANAEMDAIQQQIVREMPDIAASTLDSARLMPVREVVLGGSARRMMMLLLGAVGLVLLIACVNVANLLLARGASRQKEIAVRFSLGATRLRIVRQLLVEAAVLATLGATAGLALAWATVHYLSTFPWLQPPGTPPVAIDLTVLAFVAAVSAVTVLVAGMLPAWQTSQVSPMETLKGPTAARLGSARHQRLGNALVVAEVALSVVLLASGGLLVRRFVNLLHADSGIDPTGVLTIDITRGRDTSAEAARNFYDQVLEQVKALPGVEAAAVSTTLPMGGWYYGVPYRRPEQPKEVMQRQYGMLNVVSVGYFPTLRLRIFRGRAFNAQDSATATPVVIVNRRLAERFFRDEDPIGKTLLVGAPFDDKAEVAREVIGIAGDVRDSGIEAPIAEDVYLPFEQYPVPWEYLSVRTRSEPTALIGSIRASIAAVDKDQPLDDIATMQQRIDDSIQWSRFATSLLAAFAGLSLVLAAVGIYGVVSYTTAQRTAEFGLRMALGARPAAVLRLAMNSGAKLVLAGSGVGILAAVAVARLVSSAAEGINPRDPLVFVTALVVIVTAAFPATLLPARGASKVDPMVALRHD